MLISVEFEGLDALVSRLEALGEKVETGSEQVVAKVGADAQKVMIEATHRRSGKLQEGDELDVSGLEFRLFNEVFYAPFVEAGHNTPAGWRTKHGYRPAKHRHWVEARPFLKPAEEYATEELTSRLATILDD